MFVNSFSILLLSTAALLATVREEAEDYAGALFRAHKELKKENSTTKSKARFLDDLSAANRRFFYVSPVDQELLDKRKNIVADDIFKQKVDLLKAYKNQTEAEFLIAYVEKEKPRREQQLFLHRYIDLKIQDFKKANTDAIAKILKAIQTAYVAKKEALGKKPSFAELELPAEIAKFKDPASGKETDWLYTGDKAYTSSNKQVVVAVPVADTGGRVLAIRDDGSTTTMLTFAKVSSVAKAAKPAEKPKPDPAEKTDGTKDPAKKYALETSPEHLAHLKEKANIVLEVHKRYKVWKNYDQATSNGLEQLKLRPQSSVYNSADGNTTHTWVYLGATHQVNHAKGRVICLTSTAVSGTNFLGFLEDGSHVIISPEQHKAILANAIAAHKSGLLHSETSLSLSNVE